jgi:outer membrane lipoprotein-sorting protein
MKIFRYLRFVLLAGICLAASPAAPVPARTVIETERLPYFDTSGALPSQKQFEKLATTDAIATLKASIIRAQREVRGYRAIFLKQERMGGTLHPAEEIAVAFREEPFATLMLWKKGSRMFAEGTLYAVGENDGKMLVWLPSLFNRVSKVSTRDGLARGSARYGIEDFGIILGSQRTLKAWDTGELDVEYLGLKPVPELDGKKCYAIRRTCRTENIDPFLLGDPPVPITDKNRVDAFKTITIYFDPETWLQVGSEQKRADGERIGGYFFKDVQLNPAFTKDEFKPTAFKK